MNIGDSNDSPIDIFIPQNDNYIPITNSDGDNSNNNENDNHIGDNKPSRNSLQRERNNLDTSNILQSKLRTENYTRSSTKDYTFLTALNYVPNESTKVEEPLKFKDAWFNKSLSDRKGWRESICDEFETMKKKEVWKIVNRNDVPKIRKS